MANCVRCACGQFLDADDSADCPTCGRTLLRATPDRTGFRIVIVLTGFLATASLIAILAVVSRNPPLTVLPNTEMAAPKPEGRPAEIAQVPPAQFPHVLPPIKPEKPDLPPRPDPEPNSAPIEQQPPVRTHPRTGTLEANPVDVLGGYKVGETLHQDLVVTRRSTYRIMGVDLSQGAQYALGSSLTVTAIKDDSSLVVEQTILTARLIDADPDMKAEMTAALEKAKGTTFELTVGPTGDVTAVKGLKDPIQVKSGKEGVADAVRLWSLMDADGWKELAGLMFFQPEKARKPGAKWSKDAAHDWGPLGGWRGKTNYVARGKVSAKSPLDRIEYAHAIYYKPPTADADRGLPFRVGKADFKPVQTVGAINYDAVRQRSTAAEETFHVRGFVQAFLGDTQVVIEMEERQNFKLAFTDPGKGELTGTPPKKK